MNIARGSLFVSTCLVLSLGANLHAETAPSVDWIKQIGTAQYDSSESVTVDTAGNVYISGYTQGSLNGPNAGNTDAFLTKFDASGNELWSAQIGTTSSDYGRSVAVDAMGNAYISGFTEGDLVGPNAGSGDAFLIKFDPSGNELWSRQIGTTSSDTSYSMAVDAAGDVYISGSTWGSFNGPNAGRNDAYLIKFDTSGNELWSTQIGTTSSDASYSVAVDAAGNAYISGFTQGSLSGSHAGEHDAFLTKFDPSGTELWTTQIGSVNADFSNSVTIDSTGNAYISGSTFGDLAGPNAGYSDAFLTKFDNAGNELWSRQIGTAGWDPSFSVTVGAAGNVYISGSTGGNLGGPNAGSDDAFLTKFDTAGNELWTTQIGTMEDDTSSSVTMDAAGDVYISGVTWGNLGRPNAGEGDAFLVKFTIPEPTTLALLALSAPVLLRRR